MRREQSLQPSASATDEPNREQGLKLATSAPQQPHGHAYRTYTLPQLLVVLEIPRSTFFHLRKKGGLPFLQELRPRLGRVVRYRADLVDRYLAGEWNQPRAFRSHVRPKGSRPVHRPSRQQSCRP